MAAREVEDTSPVSDVLAGGGVDPSGAALSAAQETIKQHRKRGPKPGSKRGASAEQVAATQAEMARHIDALFSPENWEGICKAPADLMLALSGNKIWDVPRDEVKTLSVHASATARYFMATDPKWIALTLFAFSLATTYGSRALIHMKDAKKRSLDDE